MSNLIVTSDAVPNGTMWHKEYGNHTFSIYDLNTKCLVYVKEKVNDLESNVDYYWGQHNFRPFGITSQEDKIYISSNDRIGIFDKHTYDFVGLLNVPVFLGTHQILIEEDTMYVTHTAINKIGIHNYRTGQNIFIDLLTCAASENIEQIKINHVYEFDKLHVNALYKKEHMLYFCAHTKGPHNSKFGYIDLNTLQVYPLFNGGVKAHNVIVVDDYIYSLSSGTGDFLKYNLKTGTLKCIPLMEPEKIFLRGMVFYNNKLLIGCSNVITNFEKVMSYLMEFDIETETFKKFMDIPSSCYITDMHIIV